MIKTKNFLLNLFAFFLMHTGFAQSNLVNWEKLLSRNDMVFDTLTSRWEDGVFTGNGLVGAMLYMDDLNTLRLEIGRTDVVDHRKDSMSALYAKARLPIGYFELTPIGKILKNTARLHLWNAEATGEIVTDKGTINWRSLTLSQTNVIVFETNSTGEEKKFSWQWRPEISISSRTRFSKDFPETYKANPHPFSGKEAGVKYCRQLMIAGGDYTTAWKENIKGNDKTVFICIGYSQNKSSVDDAVKTVNATANKNFQQLILAHRRWWHNYYAKSFISIPDARMESFYWIQQYKLASATREGEPAVDLMGPWFRYTPWPAYWFNLNLELTYSPLFTANRLSLATTLIKMIDDAKENLIKNAPLQYQYNAAAVGRAGAIDMIVPVKVFSQLDTSATPSQLELGNLTWCLYYYWQYYRYTMDENVKNKFFPVLKRSINYYLDIMNKGEDGKWHLPYTYSPEYPDGITRDCNYDLSLFRWGCGTLFKINPEDSLAGKWKDVLKNLTDYPTDSSGLRIGSDVAFSQSHRHYSHLLMIYPLHLMNWEQTEKRKLIKKSLLHWHSFEGALQGYSFTGGASIYATMGDGNKALNYLNELLDRFVKPNTMYLETGPVIETPLAAATSIQELLIQSWDDKIRIFPAIPDNWKDVAFENLRTEGAFLISAVRKDGETKWVRVKSLAGVPCMIHLDINGVIKIKGNGTLTDKGNGNYLIHLSKDAEVVLYKNEKDLLIKVGDVKQVGEENYWGKKLNKQE
jgi:alpha-L-fucosidase 2